MDAFYYDENTMCVPIKLTENETFTVDSVYINDVVSALTKCGYIVQYEQINRFYYNVWVTGKEEVEDYDLVLSMEIANE